MPDDLLHKLLETAETYDGSDIHLTANEIPYFRVNRQMVKPTAAPTLSEADIEQIVNGGVTVSHLAG